jgi:phage host-nuclease inhibitor protein Gam
VSEEKLDNIIAGIGELKTHVTRLNTAVLGDDEAGIDGLADRTGKVEKEVETLQDKITWAKGGAWAVAVFAAFMGFIKDHIKWLN